MSLWRPSGLSPAQHAEIDAVVAACNRPPVDTVLPFGHGRQRFDKRNQDVQNGRALAESGRRRFIEHG